MSKLYINTKDYQGGTFAVGEVGTLKQWRELAMEWCDTDQYQLLHSELKRYKVKNDQLINFINNIWDIYIVEFDENNEEHLQLRKERERF